MDWETVLYLRAADGCIFDTTIRHQGSCCICGLPAASRDHDAPVFGDLPPRVPALGFTVLINNIKCAAIVSGTSCPVRSRGRGERTLVRVHRWHPARRTE